MLEVLLFYRLDIDYIQGMANLAGELLLFLDEYDALCCFINLTHSYHFLSFLRGDMREVEWRVAYFEQYFKRELPDLFQHFRALDLSTEIFLFHWFLSLFTA